MEPCKPVQQPEDSEVGEPEKQVEPDVPLQQPEGSEVGKADMHLQQPEGLKVGEPAEVDQPGQPQPTEQLAAEDGLEKCGEIENDGDVVMVGEKERDSVPEVKPGEILEIEEGFEEELDKEMEKEETVPVVSRVDQFKQKKENNPLLPRASSRLIRLTLRADWCLSVQVRRPPVKVRRSLKPEGQVVSQAQCFGAQLA